MRVKASLAAFFLVFAAATAQTQTQKVIRVKPGFATIIICPAAPDLITTGNSQDFKIQNSRNYVLVKPLVNRGSTNMFIRTGADTYHLILRISETPDLEVRLQSSLTAPQQSSNLPSSTTTRPGKVAIQRDTPTNGADHSIDDQTRNEKLALRRTLLRAKNILPTYLRKKRPYTYSVRESSVTLAVDHMVQIQDKLFVLSTIVNESKIPYDIGFVRFKLIDHDNSMVFFKKKKKETDLEPIHEVLSQTVNPNSSRRLLFIFDKQGFSDMSTLEIKCIEENGRRDMVLEVPGTFIE